MKLITLSLVCMLSIGLFACERDPQGVEAAREEERQDTFPPQPAPAPDPMPGTMMGQEIRGTLERVDIEQNTLMVRTEIGQEQMVHFDEQTTFSGIGPTEEARDLMGMEGAEVVVRLKDDATREDPQASSIFVTDMPRQQQEGERY